MGILDLPSPLLSRIDLWLTDFLPPLVKLMLWAAIGALISMELYRLLSPQKRIAQLKLALQRAQRRVIEFDGDFAEGWPHIRRMLSFALRRVAIVLPATIIASLPVLVFIVWLDQQYGGSFPPPGEAVGVEVSDGYSGRWVDDGLGATPRAEVRDAAGTPIAEIPVTKPTPVIHKWRWWNTLIGNPAGYLPDELPIEQVVIALPRQQILPVGPDWLRGWEVVFFAALTLFALAFKTVRRIQ